MSIRGYKVFNPDWTCKKMQYEVGKTYKYDGPISICKAGFHFCKKVAYCFNYYSFNPENKVAEVEATGLVQSDGTKYVTNEIKILRELSWAEMLELANTGKGNTGLNNSGDMNSGSQNSGDRNTGDWNTGNMNSGSQNSGDWNTGNMNSGSQNSGDWNTGNMNFGDRNTGHFNSGSWNSGSWNSGYLNTGHFNSGSWNFGDRNTGHFNSGSWNSGSWNSGDLNTGRFNSGSWNSGDRNTGFFSTLTPKVDIFEKPSEFTYEQALNIPGIEVLDRAYMNNWWVYSEEMTYEEKAAHPEHETTGGYLKSIPFKDACALMWKKLCDDDKRKVLEIPNFDADIFYRITGIKVGGQSDD